MLTKHFSLNELTISQEAARSGLKNTPNAAQTESLRLLCENVLEPLRARVKRPIIVSSGFRSTSVNRRVGGSDRSQHTKGQAVDFSINGLTPAEIVRLMVVMKLPVDQLIEEFGAWVHVSHASVNRGQVLKARKEGGKTVYRSFF